VLAPSRAVVPLSVLLAGTVASSLTRELPPSPTTFEAAVVAVAAVPVAAVPAPEPVVPPAVRLPIPDGKNEFVFRTFLFYGIGPGSRVELLAVLRKANSQLVALRVADDVLVLATDIFWADPDLWSTKSKPMTVSVAVDRKEAIILQLVKDRGCDLEMMIRRPGVNDDAVSADKLIAYLTNTANWEVPVAPAPRRKAAAGPANPPGMFIPAGKNVYSLKLDPDVPANGFIMPGGRVDVIVTVRKDGKLHSVVAAADLLVLAVDVTSAPGGKITGMTVSLAVDPKEARVLELARAKGVARVPLLRGPGGKPAAVDLDKVIELLGEPVEAPAPRRKR
jgi:Flp pilus assembly protein CpaB